MELALTTRDGLDWKQKEIRLHRMESAGGLGKL
jgi:hypothetical protein